LDLVSSTTTTISWGPYILLALGAIGVVTWYFIRRLISTQDDLRALITAVALDVGILKDRQAKTPAQVKKEIESE